MKETGAVAEGQFGGVEGDEGLAGEVVAGDTGGEVADGFIVSAGVHADGAAEGAGDVVEDFQAGEVVIAGDFAEAFEGLAGLGGDGLAGDGSLGEVVVEDDEVDVIVTGLGQDDIAAAADDDFGAGWIGGQLAEIFGGFREPGTPGDGFDPVGVVGGQVEVGCLFHGVVDSLFREILWSIY